MKIVNIALVGIAVMFSAAVYADDCSEMGYESFLNATTVNQDNNNVKNDVKSEKITITKSDSEKNKTPVATSQRERILLNYANS